MHCSLFNQPKYKRIELGQWIYRLNKRLTEWDEEECIMCLLYAFICHLILLFVLIFEIVVVVVIMPPFRRHHCRRRRRRAAIAYYKSNKFSKQSWLQYI